MESKVDIVDEKKNQTFTNQNLNIWPKDKIKIKKP